MSEIETGTVKWFNNKKGYGFITRDSGDDIFVHYSQIVGEGFKTLQEGDRVEFSVNTESSKGPAANQVRKLPDSDVPDSDVLDSTNLTSDL